MARRPTPTDLTINPPAGGDPSTLDGVPLDALTVTVSGKSYLVIATGLFVIGYAIETDGTLSEVFEHETDAYGLGSALLEDGSAMIYALENDAVRYISLEVDGKSTLFTETIADSEFLALEDAQDIHAFQADGYNFFAVASPFENGVSLFALDKAGGLAEGDTVFDDKELDYLGGARAVTSAMVGGVTYVYVAAAEDSAITGLPIGLDKPVYPTLVDDESLPLLGVWDIEAVTLNGLPYLVASSPAEDAVSIFSIGDGGVLTLVDVFDDLVQPRNMAVAEIDGITYIAVQQGVGALWKSTIPLTGDGIGYSLFTLDENANFVRVAAVDTNIDIAELNHQPLIFDINGEPHLFVWGDEENNLFKLVPPIIDMTPMTVTVAENTTPVTTVPNTSGEDVAYSLGGVDAGFFSIDADGNVWFKSAPDFENPTDAGADNIYDIEVTATDSNGSDTKVLTVEVTNVSGPDIVGTKKKDKLNGTDEDETILGRNGKDKLNGFAGGDLLDGGKKKDKLTGGEDADQFRFSSKLKDKWADKIKDFEVGEDTILLDAGIFKKLDGPGALAADAFGKGKKAGDADERILHHEKSGNLYYDKDGKGGKDAVKFAKVGKGLDLSEGDFWVA